MVPRSTNWITLGKNPRPESRGSLGMKRPRRAFSGRGVRLELGGREAAELCGRSSRPRWRRKIAAARPEISRSVMCR